MGISLFRTLSPIRLATRDHHFSATVLNGPAVQAVSGATETELKRVAELAMRAWPDAS